MSSVTSSASSGRARAGAGKLAMSQEVEVTRSFGAMFETELPLFPFLRQVGQRGVHRHLVRAGFVLECLQTLALAALPYHNWSFSLRGILQALLIVALPIYDPQHIAAGWEITAAAVCVALALLVFLGATVIAAMVPEEDGVALLPPRLVQAGGAVAHAYSGWLLVPVLSVCASFFFCTADGEYTWWFSGTLECSSNAGIAMRIIAIITFVAATATSLFVRTIIFDSNPTGGMHILARAHAKVDVLIIAYRASAVVLWHYFIATGQLLYIAPYAACGSAMILIATVVMVPYHSVNTQFAVVCAHAAAVLSAIWAGISHSGEDHVGRLDVDKQAWWRYVAQKHIDTAIFLGVILPLSAAFAGLLYRARFSRTFLRDLRLLCHEGKLSSTASLFPANLPTVDEANRHDYVKLMTELAVEAEEGERDPSVGYVPFHFTTPVINAVYMSTDVELAARFLAFFTNYTGLSPSAHMVGFAARIFTRGRLRFSFDGGVSIAYVQFLVYQAKRPTVAHQELLRIRRSPLSLRARYESFRMLTSVESLLHMTKKTRGRQLAVDRVKRHHRDVLTSISDFWALLSTEDCDANSLGVVTSSVINNREGCVTLYTRLLTNNPQHLECVALYAKFCEDVLNNQDATQQTIQSLAEAVEIRAAHATRGARANAALDTMTPLPLNIASELTSYSNDAGRVNAAQRQSYLFTSFVALLALAVLLTAVFFNAPRTDTLEATFYAGRLRSVAATAHAALVELPVALGGGNATHVAALQRQITAAADDMRLLWNPLFRDTYRPVTPSHVNFRRASVFFGPGTGSDTLSIWGLVGVTIEALRNVAADANASRNAALSEATHVLGWELPAALNRTVVLYEEDVRSRDLTAAVVASGLLIAIALAMMVTFTALVTSVHSISRVRAEILGLFGYIRRDSLQTLLLNSKKKVADFETFLGLDEKEKTDQLLTTAIRLNGDPTQGFGLTNSGRMGGTRPNAQSALDELGNLTNLRDGESQGGTTQGEVATAAGDEKGPAFGPTAAADVSALEGVYPTAKWQPFVTFTVVLATTVAACLTVGLFFPTYTAGERHEIISAFATANVETTRQIRDCVFDVQRAIATGRWINTSSYGCLSVATAAEELRATFVELGAPTDASQRIALAERKLRSAQLLLRVGATFATSIPLVSGVVSPAGAIPTVSWSSGPWREETSWRFEPTVVDGGDSLPYRRLPRLLGKAKDLLRPEPERLQLAIAIGLSDLVTALRESAVLDINAATSISIDTVQHHDDALQRGLYVATIILLGAVSLPIIALLLRREMQIANGIRLTWSIAVCLTIAAVFTTAACGVAIAAVTLNDYGREELPSSVARRDAQLLHDTAARHLASAALHYAARDGDPVWLARLYRTFGDDTRDVQRPVAEMLRGGVLATDDVDDTAAGIESTGRLVFETLPPRQTSLNITRVRGILGHWNIAAQPAAVEMWLRFYAGTEASAIPTALTVAYEDFTVLPASVGGASRTTADVDAWIANATGSQIRPSVVAVAAATAAIHRRAGWPSIRDTFRFAGVEFAPSAESLNRVGHYAVEAADVAVSSAAVKLRVALASVTAAPFDAAFIGMRSRLDTILHSAEGHSGAFDSLEMPLNGLILGFTLGAVGATLTGLFISAVRTSMAIKDDIASDSTASGNGLKNSLDEATALTGENQSLVTARRQQKRAHALEDREQTSLGQAMEPALMTVVVMAVVGLCGGFVSLDYRAASTSGMLVAAATGREFIVAASLTHGRLVVRSDAALAADSRRELAELLKEARRGLERLYFAGGTRIVGFEAGSHILFAMDSHHQEELAALAGASTCANSTSLLLGVEADARGRSQVPLQGVITMYDNTFLRLLDTLVNRASTATQAQRVVASMEAIAPGLLRALQLSSDEYLEQMRNDRRSAAIDVGCSAGGIMLAVALYIVIVKYRFVHGMQRVEASARAMIQLIPPAIADSTPAIQAYLETGTGETEIQDVAANSEALITDAISTMSTLPVIAIDSKGIIIKFTNAAERVFGFSAADVTGINVRILMPPDIAQEHDAFLARYVRTRTKHVVDTTRRTRAMRRNGEVFPAEISVKELSLGGGETVYIGFVRDQSTALQLSVQGVLNKYVLHMSESAIIAIDERGTIILASQRASDMFGFEPHEMMRENVKMLMPAETALQHDGYLQRYRETGVKRVIGLRNVMTAQRKNGEVFRMSMTVREIKLEEYGEVSTFVATLTDVTDVEQIRAQSQVQDLISDLSPTPIIAITDDGTIVKFSKAASRLFGYAGEDLIAERQNIQALMPEFYSSHSEYISNYRRGNRSKPDNSRVLNMTRKVLAMRRNRSVFPVEITVKEVVKDGVAPIFLAFVTDASELVEVEVDTAITDAAMETSLVPLIAINTVGTVSRYNKAAEQVFGFSAAEVIGQNIKMLMPRNIAAKHDAYLERYLRTRQRTVIDRTRHVIGQRKNGQRVPLELSVREVAATETTPASYIGYARDITIEREVRRQYQINDLVSELSTVPIIAIDDKGTIRSFSRAAEETFGYTAMEVVGVNVRIIMPQDVGDKHDTFLLKFHMTGVKTVIDNTNRVVGQRKDGSRVPLELSVREIKDPKGGKSSFVAFARETTEDGALAAASRLADAIRDMSIVPYVEVQPDGAIQYVNEALLKEFGYSDKSDLLGRNVNELMFGHVAEEHDGYMLRYLKGRGVGLVGSTRRVVAKRFDGAAVHMELSLGEFKSNAGTGRHFFVGYLQSINGQLELEHANATVNSITNMSTTPIIAIDGSGTVVTFNSAAEHTFGYTTDEVRGQNVKVLMPHEVAEKHDTYLRTYSTHGLEEHHRPDGTPAGPPQERPPVPTGAAREGACRQQHGQHQFKAVRGLRPRCDERPCPRARNEAIQLRPRAFISTDYRHHAAGHREDHEPRRPGAVPVHARRGHRQQRQNAYAEEDRPPPRSVPGGLHRHRREARHRQRPPCRGSEEGRDGVPRGDQRAGGDPCQRPRGRHRLRRIPARPHGGNRHGARGACQSGCVRP
jgi:PAS domain S-box-containing protein